MDKILDLMLAPKRTDKTVDDTEMPRDIGMFLIGLYWSFMGICYVLPEFKLPEIKPPIVTPKPTAKPTIVPISKPAATSVPRTVTLEYPTSSPADAPNQFYLKTFNTVGVGIITFFLVTRRALGSGGRFNFRGRLGGSNRNKIKEYINKSLKKDVKKTKKPKKRFITVKEPELVFAGENVDKNLFAPVGKVFQISLESSESGEQGSLNFEQKVINIDERQEQSIESELQEQVEQVNYEKVVKQLLNASTAINLMLEGIAGIEIFDMLDIFDMILLALKNKQAIDTVDAALFAYVLNAGGYQVTNIEKFKQILEKRNIKEVNVVSSETVPEEVLEYVFWRYYIDVLDDFAGSPSIALQNMIDETDIEQNLTSVVANQLNNLLIKLLLPQYQVVVEKICAHIAKYGLQSYIKLDTINSIAEYLSDRGVYSNLFTDMNSNDVELARAAFGKYFSL